jgi:hypothetical protein
VFPVRNTLHAVEILNSYQGDSMAVVNVALRESHIDDTAGGSAGGAQALLGATVDQTRAQLDVCNAHTQALMEPFWGARPTLHAESAYLESVHLPQMGTSIGRLPGDMYWTPRLGHEDTVREQYGMYRHLMDAAMERYALGADDLLAVAASVTHSVAGSAPHPRTADAVNAVVNAATMMHSSYQYRSDVAVVDGRRKPIEDFGYADTTASGDCEDVARAVVVLLMDVRNIDHTDAVLMAAALLLRNYVAMPVLCTVTTPAAAMMSNYAISGNKTESAHATVQLIPAPLFERMVLEDTGTDRAALLAELRADHLYVVTPGAEHLPLVLAEATGYVAPTLLARRADAGAPTSLLGAATASDHDTVRSHLSGVTHVSVTVGNRTLEESRRDGGAMSSFYRRMVHGFMVTGPRVRMLTFVEAARPNVYGTRIEDHIGADAADRVRILVHPRPTDEVVAVSAHLREMTHPPVTLRPCAEKVARAPAAYMDKLQAKFPVRALPGELGGPRCAVDAFVREMDVNAPLVKAMAAGIARVPGMAGIEVVREFITDRSRVYRVRVHLA